MKNLAQTFNIDLSKYQAPIKTPSCISPDNRIPLSCCTKSVDFYPLRQNGSINIYTDGSKSFLGTGCAFVIFPPSPLPLRQEQYKMKPENTVYQAELVAVLQSLKNLFSFPFRIVSNCTINIFTDSQSQIGEISNIYSDNYVVREIHKLLHFFNSISSVSIIWCKGHSNILGNEVADYFARQSVLKNNETDAFKLPISHLKSSLKEIEKQSWSDRWRNSDKARDTYSFLPKLPVPKHFSQNEYHHKLTQILTGHCRLKMYLNHIGVEPDPACRCREYVETVDHYLFYCKLENFNRTNTLIKTCFEQGIVFPPSREDLVNNQYLFNALNSFIKSSSRLDFD